MKVQKIADEIRELANNKNQNNLPNYVKGLRDAADIVEKHKTSTVECGFCGEEFESVSHKMAHQSNDCEEMPRTRSDRPEKGGKK